jgi:hypothetical protein
MLSPVFFMENNYLFVHLQKVPLQRDCPARQEVVDNGTIQTVQLRTQCFLGIQGPRFFKSQKWFQRFGLKKGVVCSDVASGTDTVVL